MSLITLGCKPAMKALKNSLVLMDELMCFTPSQTISY